MSNPDITKHADLSQEQADILWHTSANGRYYGNADCWTLFGLEAAGFLDRRPGWEEASNYFYLTCEGRARLRNHSANVCRYPMPKPPTKRQLRARERWERVAAIHEATGRPVGEIFKRAKVYGYA